MATKFAAQQFGEAFLTTLTQERRLKQQRDLFAQEQATRNRTITLLDVFRQGLITEGQAREKRLIETQKFNQQATTAGLIGQGFTPTDTERFNIRTGEQQRAPGAIQVGENLLLPPKLKRKSDFKKAGIGQFDGIEVATFFDPTTEETRRVPIGESEADSNLTTPFISRDKLNSAQKNFNILQKIFTEGKEDGDVIKFVDSKGVGQKTTRDNLRIARNRAFQDVILQTDERAKQLNAIYENFDQAFREYLQLAKDKKLTKDNIDKIVSRDLAGAPKDMIKEMKDLLKARIF